ncbi:MAG: hypothetical protein ACYC4Q_05925, partial [Victivallaceae bacterium]
RLVSLLLSNSTTTQKFLEVRIAIPVADYRELRYWDGLNEKTVKKNQENLYAANSDPFDEQIYPLPDKIYPEIYDEQSKPGNSSADFICKEFSGIQTLMQFPAAALSDERFVLGFGLDPRQDFSYHSSGINPSQSGFYFSVKTVLEPYENVNINFMVMTIKGKFGFRHILNSYYAAFPKLYAFAKNIDQRLLGPAETFKTHVGYKCNGIALEEFRRFRTSWINFIFEWYAHKDGLGLYLDEKVVGENYLKDYEDSIIGNQSIANANKLIAEGSELIKKQCAVSMGETFENGPRVVFENWPDSILIRSNGKPMHRQNKMSGDSYVSFTYACKFWEFLKKTVDTTIAEYKPSSLYIDNCQGPRPNFNKSIPQIPARSFTEGKPYISQGYGNMKLLQYMQSFKSSRGKRIATVANTPSDYMVARTCDAALVEGGAWLGETEWAWGLRTLMGKKPVVQWGPKGFKNWLEYSEDEGRGIIEKQVKVALLFSLNTGCLLNTAHAVRGYAASLAWLPDLINIARKGWEPVTNAFVSGANLKLERFGDAHFTLVNYSDKSQTSKIQFEPLCNIFIYKLKIPDCQGITNNVNNGFNTIELKLPAVSGAILQPVISFKASSEDNLTATFSHCAEAQDVITFSELKSQKEISIYCQPEWKIFSIKINDSLVRTNATTDGWEKVLLPAGKNIKIDIRYATIIAMPAKEALKSFPFFKDDDTPGFSVFCPDPLEDCFLLQIKRLTDYLRYFLSHKKMKSLSREELFKFNEGNHDTRMTLRASYYAPELSLPITVNSKIGEVRFILATGTYKKWLKKNLGDFKPSADGVYKLDENTIVVYGRKKTDISVVMDSFLYKLDEIFPIADYQRWVERRYMKAKFWNLHVAS